MVGEWVGNAGMCRREDVRVSAEVGEGLGNVARWVTGEVCKWADG